MSSVLGIRCAFPITDSSGLGLSVGRRKQTPAAIVINGWSWESLRRIAQIGLNFGQIDSHLFWHRFAGACWFGDFEIVLIE